MVESLIMYARIKDNMVAEVTGLDPAVVFPALAHEFRECPDDVVASATYNPDTGEYTNPNRTVPPVVRDLAAEAKTDAWLKEKGLPVPFRPADVNDPIPLDAHNPELFE
tara:strand:- start:205 stop:531 length:327 start_codon:yes stop_codon:yes gene_type:complete